MKQKIRISILGIQNNGNDPESILTTAHGMYCFKNGIHKINYCELDKNGMVSDNLLYLSKTEIRLIKSGSIAGQFLFIPNKKTTVNYLSLYGRIVFDIETESFNVFVKKSCLKVQLKYRLYSGNQLFSENNIFIVCEESKYDYVPDKRRRN